MKCLRHLRQRLDSESGQTSTWTSTQGFSRAGPRRNVLHGVTAQFIRCRIPRKTNRETPSSTSSPLACITAGTHSVGGRCVRRVQCKRGAFRQEEVQVQTHLLGQGVWGYHPAKGSPTGSSNGEQEREWSRTRRASSAFTPSFQSLWCRGSSRTRSSFYFSDNEWQNVAGTHSTTSKQQH